MSVDLRALYESGELAQVARASSSRADMAARLGLTEQALRRRLESRGLPTFSALRAGPPLPADYDYRKSWEESGPVARPANESTFGKHEHGPNCTYEVGGRWSCEYPSDFADEERTQERVPAFDVSDAPVHASSRGQESPIPLGHFEKGRSTLVRGAPGSDVVLTWHKTTVSQQQHYEAIVRAFEDLPKPWQGQWEHVEQVEVASENLLNVFMMGDPHLGLMTWGKETGVDHDLATGERDLIAAVDHLVDQVPAADIGIVCSLGDLVHVDNESNTTTRGTKQDADSRWFKVMQTTLRAKRRMIDRAKLKHRRVLGRVIRGNHDWHSAAMIAMGLAQYYENDPRVEIEVSPDPFSWFEFGKNLLGWTHTDECNKPDDLAGVMAVDQAEAWGRTIYRYMMGGHEHHVFAKETHGVLVERFPTLAPKCSWAHRKGYRALQSMCADTYHAEWGRIARRTVGIRQLRAA